MGDCQDCTVKGIAAKMMLAPFDLIMYDSVSASIQVFDRKEKQCLFLGPLQLLQKYHEFFSDLLSTTRAPIMVGCLENDVFIYYSRAVPGRRAEELHGMHLADLFRDEFKDVVNKALRLAKAIGAAVFVGNITDPARFVSIPTKNVVVSLKGGLVAFSALAEESPAGLQHYLHNAEAANDV